MRIDEMWKIVEEAGDTSECIEFPECAHHISGYVLVRTWGRGQVARAHRLVLERKLGRLIRLGYEACHRCDNKGCLNPSHIYEGTRSENRQDIFRRKRV
jgi:hypothetical protein